ncbi:hypothetical protein MPSEU_001024800 [Mayamaea pseudoterrestris]|nr:hypothetical protein MPSEU_001024800 [Mayamaea pseudoterrestris]
MWGGAPVSGVPPAGLYGGQQQGVFNGSQPQAIAPQQPQASMAAGGAPQKHDIFVGNLAFNTTEEQLHQAFSDIGKVINVRLVSDMETGKPRGFAFVEFEDPQAALSAIRNMNDYELNNRRLRVNFSNSTHLEVLAGKLGMDLSQQTQRQPAAAAASAMSAQPVPAAASAGTNAVADAIKDLSKAEMYDIVAKLKEINDRDPDEARRVLSSHPQLPEALLFLMSKLDMVKTPLPSDMTATLMAPVAPAPAVVRAADPRARADPRQAAATAKAPAAAPPARVDPRQQQRIDPRKAARAAAAPATQAPPPPTYAPAPPPVPHQQPSAGNVAQLDPGLIQQVMSLTPLQIQQLPPDKRQSILMLRQQITGNSGNM